MSYSVLYGIHEFVGKSIIATALVSPTCVLTQYNSTCECKHILPMLYAPVQL